MASRIKSEPEISKNVIITHLFVSKALFEVCKHAPGFRSFSPAQKKPPDHPTSLLSVCHAHGAGPCPGVSRAPALRQRWRPPPQNGRPIAARPGQSNAYRMPTRARAPRHPVHRPCPLPGAAPAPCPAASPSGEDSAKNGIHARAGPRLP